MLKVPDGWRLKPLAELVSPDKPIVYGIVQAGPHVEGGIPYIKSSDVGSSIDVASLARTSPEIAKRYKRSDVGPGDIVFSLRGNIGELSIVPEELRKANLTQGTARIAVGQGVSNEFLAYALRAPALQHRIQVVAKGSTFREISLEALRELEVPLPSLPEQLKIAEILKTWDQAIELTSREIEQRKHLLAALRQRLIGSNGLFRSGWVLEPLGRVAKRVQRSSDGASHPVMTISAKSGFILQSDRYSRDMAGKSLEDYTLLREGEFAYNKGNSKTFPQGCVFQLKRESALVPFVYICFDLADGLNGSFYSHVFAAGLLNPQLARLINSGVRNDGLLNISAEDFFTCRVPVPPLETQSAIARVLDLATREISLLELRHSALCRQKRGLMQKLLTGEWRISARGRAA